VWHARADSLRTMLSMGVSTVFIVGFTVFVIAFVVLVILTVRFTLQRGAISRRNWMNGGADGLGRPSGSRAGWRAPERRMTALVLAGGGTKGANQVGMLQVLAEHGIVPDRIYGASVGAVNGAAYAGDPTVEGVAHLTRVWRGITGDHVFPQRLVHGPWQFLQQRESVHSNSGLRTIIEDGVAFERLEDSTIPIEVVATSAVDGGERWFTSGPAVEAILASSAIPAVLPSVEIDGDRLIDGGVVNNVPIGRAIDAGATRIIVLLCGLPNYVPTASKRPVEALLNALFISIHARFTREMGRLPPGIEVIVCSGGSAVSRDYTDFTDTDALIEAGRAEALAVFRRHGLIDHAMDVPSVPDPPGTHEGTLDSPASLRLGH
jgi:NTE family protein